MASKSGETEEVSKPLPGGSFEGCVRRFGQEPGIEDPEAFCGWLEQQQKEGNEAVLNWDAEEDSIGDLIEALNDPQAEKVLQDLTVTYVSGVENPAQDSQWVMAKDADDRGADWGVTAPLVVKEGDLPMTDEDGEEEQKAWAPVLIPNETDKQGDVIPVKEIETAAHDFLAEYRQVDTDHDLLAGKGVPIESWTLKTDTTFDLPDGSESREYPAGTWFMGVQFNDESWDRIKAGELTGFSIYGEAENTPVAEILGLDESAKEVDRTNGGEVALAKDEDGNETSMRDNESKQLSPDAMDSLQSEFDAFLEDTGATPEDASVADFMAWLADNMEGEEPDNSEDNADGEGNETEETSMSDNENESKEEEAGEAETSNETEDGEQSSEDMLKSIKSTVEDNNEAVKSVKSRVDTLEERVEDLEKGEADGSGETDGEETGEASEAEAEKQEEDLNEAAEEAVKSVFGLDDLPEDAEERREVIRKGLVEAEEDDNEIQTIGFTQEDLEEATQ